MHSLATDKTAIFDSYKFSARNQSFPAGDKEVPGFHTNRTTRSYRHHRHPHRPSASCHSEGA